MSDDATVQSPGDVKGDSPIADALKKFEAETPPDEAPPAEDESAELAPPVEEPEKKEEGEPETKLEAEPKSEEAKSEEPAEPEKAEKEKEEEDVEPKPGEEEEEPKEEEPKEEEPKEEEPKEEEPKEEEPKEEEEPELVAIELPEALREQGVDAIEVAPEDERIMRALVNDYEGRKTREVREKEFESVQERLAEDWIQGNTIMAAAPLTHAAQKLGVNPEAIMDEIKLHFLENPGSLKQVLEWHERLEEVEERAPLEKQTLTQRRETRFREAQNEMRERYNYKQEAVQVDVKLRELVDAAVQDQAIRNRLMNVARQQLIDEVNRRVEAGKSEMVRPDEVEGLVGWLIEPYKTKREEPKTAAKEPPEKKAEKTRKRFETRAKRHEESAKKPRSAAGQVARRGPRKGQTLEEVLEHLKSTVT